MKEVVCNAMRGRGTIAVGEKLIGIVIGCKSGLRGNVGWKEKS